MNDSAAEKRKIFVDEDWKSQVEAEKEALKNTGPATAPEKKAEDSTHQPSPEIPFPEASFAMLIMTLATQAMVALGQSDMPEDKQLQVDLKMAKHLIDTLDILQQKTTGNLSGEESNLLTNYLYQLRMLYVMVQDEKKKQPRKGSIETP